VRERLARDVRSSLLWLWLCMWRWVEPPPMERAWRKDPGAKLALLAGDRCGDGAAGGAAAPRLLLFCRSKRSIR